MPVSFSMNAGVLVRQGEVAKAAWRTDGLVSYGGIQMTFQKATR